MKIVLIGFMGSGKSKVGSVLARKLGWDHVDTDDLIEKKSGSTIAGIFLEKGEPGFRVLERQVVQDVAKKDKLVVSTGGGVPLNPENMSDLGVNGKIVWLEVSPDIVLMRAGNFSSRPLIDIKDPLGSVTSRLSERIPFYSQAAISVNTDKLTVDEVADEILKRIPELKL